MKHDTAAAGYPSVDRRTPYTSVHAIHDGPYWPIDCSYLPVRWGEDVTALIDSTPGETEARDSGLS